MLILIIPKLETQIWIVAHVIRGMCVTSALIKGVVRLRGGIECLLASLPRTCHNFVRNGTERSRVALIESDSLQIRVHLSPNSPLTTSVTCFEWGPSHMGTLTHTHTHTHTHTQKHTRIDAIKHDFLVQILYECMV